MDISFTRYVQERRRAREARRREGAVYAYGADLRVRSTLGRVRPVVMATEAALQNFTEVGRSRLWDEGQEVTASGFPEIHAGLLRAAAALGIEPPQAIISSSALIHDLWTLGPAGEEVVVIPRHLVDALEPDERLATLGHACGRVHNQHAPLLTTMFFLDSSARSALRWAAVPAAMALGAWAERAAITADRASLLVARDFRPTARAIIRRLGALKQLVQDIDTEAILDAVYALDAQEGGAPSPGVPPVGSLLDPPAWRALARRLRALRAFERTSFYRGGLDAPPALAEGQAPLSLQSCETLVGRILAGRA